MEIIGQVAGDTTAPNAEDVDAEGNTLNEDGTVTYHPKVAENLKRLGQAELVGFTLPYKHGGLNSPNLIYTVATEIVSRADGSLMDLFGPVQSGGRASRYTRSGDSHAACAAGRLADGSFRHRRGFGGTHRGQKSG